MRLFLRISVLLLLPFVATLTGCEATPRASANAATVTDANPIETPTATLVVHGMGCPLCANNVDKQLLAVQGVEGVNIDLGSGEVKVHLSDANRPSKQQLARAVHQSGFTLVRIDTP